MDIRDLLPDGLYYPGERLSDTNKRTFGTMAGLAIALFSFNRTPDWGIYQASSAIDYVGIAGRRTGRQILATAILSAPLPSRVLETGPETLPRDAEPSRHQLLVK